MPNRFVLDASALLALFLDEPGAENVQAILQAASDETELYMTVANLGEVLYTIELRAGVDVSYEALGSVDQSPIRLMDIDRALALLAARIKAAEGMGYLDCFVVAAAQRLNAVIVTKDVDFQALEGRVAIEWLPGARS